MRPMDDDDADDGHAKPGCCCIKLERDLLDWKRADDTNIRGDSMRRSNSVGPAGALSPWWADRVPDIDHSLVHGCTVHCLADAVVH
jgi:hypothetical protein